MDEERLGHFFQVDLVQVEFHPGVVTVQIVDFVNLVQFVVIKNLDQIRA